jgi:hypothetical protein
VPAPIFGECADRSSDWHPRRIGGDKTSVVPAEEVLPSGAQPEVASAVCK